MEVLSTLPTGWAQDAAVLVGGLSLSYYLRTRATGSKKASYGHQLPPSFKGWPLLGNALDIPLKYPGHHYQKWSDELGSKIVSASALGKTLVIVNSISIAMDLLDKHSNKNSSRAQTVMAKDLMGWDYLMAMLPNDNKWKERRRAFVQSFRPGDTSIIYPQEREFVTRLLLEMERNPDNYYESIRGAIGGFIVSLSYGLPIQPQNDPHLERSEFITGTLAEVCTPGANFVDVLPALKYIPSWLPGAGFKRKAARLAYMAEEFRTVPFDEAISCFGTEKARPSFLSVALESIDDTKGDADYQKEIVKDTAAMFYAAGTDTIVASINSWLWLLMKNPEIQVRVRAELDEVLHGRMPDFEDQASLPFLTATLMEAARYAPPAPLGVPHNSTEDDIYGDYFIPSDSVIIANIYGMLRNEEDYEYPNTFNPDRFMKDGAINTDIPNPLDYAFGFGRRVCPGAHIGRSMVWLSTASLATLFEWSEPSGLNQPEDFDPGLLLQPTPYKCDFKIRSPEARAHLSNLADAAAS